MPVERRIEQHPETTELVSELAQEYRLGANSTNSEPRIILEQASVPGILRVYVVWDRWNNLGQGARSAIIMDALEQVMPPEERIKVTVAWGLTHAEWENLQLGHSG